MRIHDKQRKQNKIFKFWNSIKKKIKIKIKTKDKVLKSFNREEEVLYILDLNRKAKRYTKLPINTIKLTINTLGFKELNNSKSEL